MNKIRIIRIGFLQNVMRSMLHFKIGFGKILADNAQTGKLDPSEAF